MVKEKVKSITKSDEQKSKIHELVLFNDDFNTFEFVIDTLVEVCEHDLHQAEQCTMLVHYKGKCGVKSGPYTELKPIYTEMLNRSLTVEIQ
jgi:ATP-dependent Clp protease adaptor protein ClpS